ncbi:MAG: GntR family transcriptional regulator [Lachnospiraceae bacterium]|nr:GntR family transcriptional regulator [Lachnospiraceae bacterium]
MNEILSQEKSIYIQIREMIENDILRDILLEEERAPSTNELARAYSINPATAAKGVNLLVDEGILYKKRGIGMFVATGAKAKIMEKRKQNFYDDYVKRLVAEAKNLGITKEELVAMIAAEGASGQVTRT